MGDAWLSALGWFGRSSAPFLTWLARFLQEGPWGPAQKSSCLGPILKPGAHWMKSYLKISVSLGQHLWCQQKCTPVLPGCASGSKHCFLLYPLVTLPNSTVPQSSNFCTNSKRQPLIHALLGLCYACNDELISQDFVLWFFPRLSVTCSTETHQGPFPGPDLDTSPCILQLATVPGSAQGTTDHPLQQGGKI